ncbi:hypothetical protein ACQEU3_11735 [Spirillospora sp. CA-253888]
MTTPRILASRDRLVSAWYSMLEVDGQAPPDPFASPPPGGWAVCRGSKLLIRTGGEDNLLLRVRFESWTAEPVVGDDRSELDPVTCTLAVPAGAVTVSDGEVAAGAFALPAPGDYRVRVTAHGRDAARLYDEAATRSRDFDDPQFQADWALLNGRETYVLRFWPAP